MEQEEEQRLANWFNQRIQPKMPPFQQLVDFRLAETELQTFCPGANDLNDNDADAGRCWTPNGWRSACGNLVGSVMQANYNPLWLEAFCRAQFDGRTLHDAIATEAALGRDDPDVVRRTCVGRLCFAIHWLDGVKRRTAGPCLFTRATNSQAVFDQLCRTTMAPERIHRFQQRLRAAGLTLQHRESAVHHLDMRVHHLSTDLCDGIRLARMIQTLLPDARFANLLDLVKYPAERARQRAENLRLVFESAGPVLQPYDSGDYGWNGQNAAAVAQSCRRETLQLLAALMRIDGAIRLEVEYRPYLDHIVGLQRAVRRRRLARVERQRFLAMRQAAIIVQRWFRATMAARRQRVHYQRLRTVTQNIQRLYRRRRNWTVVRMHTFQFLERRQRAAIVIQTAWRGYITRVKAYISECQLYVIVRRLNRRRSRPGRTIGWCTARIVNRIICFNQKITEQLLSDLEHLNRYCSWSREIRRNLAQRKELVPAFGRLMVTLNRSEQHKKCAMCIISVLEMTWRSSPVSTLLSPGLMIRTIGNYLNHPPLVLASLRLLNRMIESQPNVSMQLATDAKWSKLIERVRARYRTDGSAVTGSGPADCQLCLIIQTQLDQMS